MRTVLHQHPPARRAARASAAGLSALAAAGLALAGPASAATGSARSAPQPGGVWHLRTIFSGSTVGATGPDDVVVSGGKLFVAFQNGVGAQGEPSKTGQRDSTLVELTTAGDLLKWWQVHGKIDGMGADPATGRIVVTVDEDANSSMSVLDPASGTLTSYRYAADPLPHNGGTDAVTFWNGDLVVSASAPGTIGGKQAAAPNGSYPAAYRVVLDSATHVAQLSPLFFDEDSAAVANSGAGKAPMALALTDPDSNAVVPAVSPRFAGALAVDSQADKQLVLLGGGKLSVLKLSESIDDFTWATAPAGSLVVTDGAANVVDIVQGPFKPGTTFVAATPCDAANAPSTCPAPGFAATYLGMLDLNSGDVTRLDLRGLLVEPAGLSFIGG